MIFFPFWGGAGGGAEHERGAKTIKNMNFSEQRETLTEKLY